MFKSVVVGTDGSETATAAVLRAVELAELCGAQLHIVTAYKQKQRRVSGAPGEFQYLGSSDEADALLAEAAARAKMAGLQVATHAATADAVDAIIDTAREVGADVIVVGNKGMRGARRVLGSVPNDVAHKATCSVLIVETT